MNNKEKIKMLKQAKKLIETDAWYNSICLAIQGASRSKIAGLGVFKSFPELLKYKPKGAKSYWFPCNKSGSKKRIAIINKVIKELK